MRDADRNHAAVEHRVVDPIGERHTVGLGEEIVILDLDRRAVPFGAGLLKVADYLPLLRIHTDDGQALAFKAGTQRGDELKLLIAIGAGVAGNRFAIDTQGKVHLVQQASHGIGRNRNALLLKNPGNLLGGLPRPLHTGHGITSSVVFKNRFDGLDYFGSFFSSGFRPPPILRARSTSPSWFINSCRPRATVWGSRSSNSAS